VRYREYEGGALLRFERGESVMVVFHWFLRERGVELGHFSGIGAVSRATYGYYRLEEREYTWHEIDEDVEVISWAGNVALRDGRPWAHTHATFGMADGSTVGGHVRDAVVGATLELFLTILPGRLERRMDPQVGIALLDP
jgi:predicted DNA-binding protein with PD1-like motif